MNLLFAQIIRVFIWKSDVSINATFKERNHRKYDNISIEYLMIYK